VPDVAAQQGPWRTVRLDRLPAAPGAGLLGEHGLLGERGVVLVDDMTVLLDHPLEPALLALANDPRRSLVVAGTTAALLGSFRGLPALARTNRTGVLLCPESPGDGEVLAVRAELDDDVPPGRGVLVVRGRQTLVQVATLAPEPPADGGKTAGDLSVPGRTVPT
jgi:S-DNA-T family DNA segregation ATPase FtsK/SpoIIIE